jgi:hypothetical protein
VADAEMAARPTRPGGWQAQAVGVDIRLLIGVAGTTLLMMAAPVPAAPAASAPDVGASATQAPAAPRRAKRPLTAQELRDSASFPGDMRPEDMPPPQVTVPLGRKPPPPSPATAGAVADDAAAPGKIDDRVARCKALADVRERADCTRALSASEPLRR